MSFHHDPASPGFWSVHRHADVVAVNRDNATFSSNLKATLFWEMEEADLEQQRLMMLNMDPPHAHPVPAPGEQGASRRGWSATSRRTSGR